MPPVAVRRVIMGPLWLLLAVACVVLSPIAGLVAATASALSGNRQPLRLVHFVLRYFVWEAAVLVACLALWLASGFGLRLGTQRFQDLHYRLLGWMLDGILQPVLRSLRIDVQEEPTGDARKALAARDRPLILLSRHAGPGDSFLIVSQLLTRYGRHPRIVMKEALALDPCLDLLCHRLPNALIDTSDPQECQAQISRLSSGLDGTGVLVMFPEGGNYTPERRKRAILRLWRRGEGSRAARAEQMRNVMPPRTTGALAALKANPEADVIFAAHTGLGHEAFPMQMWRRPPVGRTVRMRMWLAPAGERPTSVEGQEDWLFTWWERLDAWIESAGEESAVSEAIPR